MLQITGFQGIMTNDLTAASAVKSKTRLNDVTITLTKN